MEFIVIAARLKRSEKFWRKKPNLIFNKTSKIIMGFKLAQIIFLHNCIIFEEWNNNSSNEIPLEQNNESKLKKHERLIIISAYMLNNINKNKLSKSKIFKFSNVTVISYSWATSHVIQSKIETRFEANFKIDIILIHQRIFIKQYQYNGICKNYDIYQKSRQTRRVFSSIMLKTFATRRVCLS